MDCLTYKDLWKDARPATDKNKKHIIWEHVQTYHDVQLWHCGHGAASHKYPFMLIWQTC